MKNKAVISLCDFTGEFVKPWAKKGFECFIFDSQHKKFSREGNIVKVPGKIEENLNFISGIIKTREICFVAGFPPCTDLAVSGAAWFEKKREENPLFQSNAMNLFFMCYSIAYSTGSPFFIENPVSVASSFFRKPDFSFHPYEYGCYLKSNDKNPVSEIIPPRDCYKKKTCLWSGNGFYLPPKKPTKEPQGYSPQHKKLGGKGLKTKNIRSATPRGFSLAVYKEFGENK